MPIPLPKKSKDNRSRILWSANNPWKFRCQWGPRRILGATAPTFAILSWYWFWSIIFQTFSEHMLLPPLPIFSLNLETSQTPHWQKSSCGNYPHTPPSSHGTWCCHCIYPVWASWNALGLTLKVMMGLCIYKYRNIFDLQFLNFPSSLLQFHMFPWFPLKIHNAPMLTFHYLLFPVTNKQAPLFLKAPGRAT